MQTFPGRVYLTSFLGSLFFDGGLVKIKVGIVIRRHTKKIRRIKIFFSTYPTLYSLPSQKVPLFPTGKKT